MDVELTTSQKLQVIQVALGLDVQAPIEDRIRMVFEILGKSDIWPKVPMAKPGILPEE